MDRRTHAKWLRGLTVEESCRLFEAEWEKFMKLPKAERERLQKARLRQKVRDRKRLLAAYEGGMEKRRAASLNKTNIKQASNRQALRKAVE